MRKVFNVGYRHGRLTLVERVTNDRRKSLWKCRCECGNEYIITETRLVRGAPKSCGCLEQENNTPRPDIWAVERRAFYGAKGRCTNKNEPNYQNYGARGIQFKFTSLAQWFTELGHRPAQGYAVDRINNDGHYEPGNVRWATPVQQRRNQRHKKLTAKDVIFIRKARSVGIFTKVLAKWFDVSAPYISQLTSQSSWWYV